jgi:hypothetical protein
MLLDFRYYIVIKVILQCNKRHRKRFHFFGIYTDSNGDTMKKAKHEIITFKADASLLEAMKGIPNRSEFIRNSILAALESACPLCSGTGVLTPQQKIHLQDFLVDHSIMECEKCHDLRLVCANGSEKIPEKGNFNCG